MTDWFSSGGAHQPDIDKQEAQLVDLYNQMIRVAYAKVRNKSDAHDVVQEAWVHMLAKRDTLREQNKLLAWAKTITRNIAFNVNKHAVRVQPRNWEDAACGDVYARAEAELMLEISELLASLDAPARTLILYKFYYGFKDQEIADAMNLPLGTVKAKIHRIRERLRRWTAAPAPTQLDES